MKRNILVLTILVIACSPLVAQNSVLPIKEIVDIESEILGENRQIALYLPDDYQNSEEKYPVLFLLDAEWSFDYVTALVGQLVNSGRIPPMIVVGIINTNRSKDLTPSGPNQQSDARYGGAKEFLAFSTQELAQFLETNYRVHPFRILAGHSFGGLFSVYSMMEQENYFGGFIALSPSVGRNNEQQVRIAENFFLEKDSFPYNLYLGVANEGGYTFQSTLKMSKILERHAPHNFRWKFEHMPLENHSSINILGFKNGLEFIYEGFNGEDNDALDEIFLVEDLYDSLSSRYGYHLTVPEYYYQKFYKQQLMEKEFDYTLYILGKYQESYARSIQMLLGYADTYLLMGDFDKAQEYYKKVLLSDPENSDAEAVLKSLEK